MPAGRIVSVVQRRPRSRLSSTTSTRSAAEPVVTDTSVRTRPCADPTSHPEGTRAWTCSGGRATVVDRLTVQVSSATTRRASEAPGSAVVARSVADVRRAHRRHRPPVEASWANGTR